MNDNPQDLIKLKLKQGNTRPENGILIKTRVRKRFSSLRFNTISYLFSIEAPFLSSTVKFNTRKRWEDACSNVNSDTRLISEVENYRLVLRPPHFKINHFPS